MENGKGKNLFTSIKHHRFSMKRDLMVINAYIGTNFFRQVSISPSFKVLCQYSLGNREKTNARFKHSILLNNVHKIPFGTKSIHLHNFVNHFFPVVFSFRVRTAKFAGLHKVMPQAVTFSTAWQLYYT